MQCKTLSFVAVTTLLWLQYGAAQTTPTPSASTKNVADTSRFNGTVARVSGTASCSAVVPPNLKDPFERRGEFITDYQLLGCWKGQLHGGKFTITEYASRHGDGAALAVTYRGKLVSRVPIGGVSIFRFYGNSFCNADKAGAHNESIDIISGTYSDQGFSGLDCDR